MKKLHSILKYAESLQGFTEIKQVSARGLPGFNRVQCLEHFCSKGRSLYCQRNPWIWVRSPSMLKKLHVDDCSRKSKYMFSFSMVNYPLKLHKKHSIKATAHEIRRFHKALHHQISATGKNSFHDSKLFNVQHYKLISV